MKDTHVYPVTAEAAKNASSSPLHLDLRESQREGSVEAILTNRGDETLTVLKWETPFEATLSANIFAVLTTNNNMPILHRAPYIGRHVKRAAPSDSSYLTLMPGESTSAVVPLNQYYDISTAQDYRVEFHGHFRYEAGNVRRKSLSDINLMGVAKLDSGGISMHLSPNYSPRILPPNYSNCSAGEQNDITAAAQVAEQLAGIARRDTRQFATLHHLVRRIRCNSLQPGIAKFCQHRKLSHQRNHQLQL